MDYSNSSSRFSFHYSSYLDQERYKIMEEEDSRRRQQRNQEIRAKIQELKLRSLLEASRSEMLRQMQNEHKALVQKYLCDQKLPNFGYSGDSAHHIQGMTTWDLNPKAPTPILVSTGINTELSGPVMSDHNSRNEIPFSRFGEKVLSEMNVNQTSPAARIPSESLEVYPKVPVSSFEYNKVTGDEMAFTTSKITFLDPSTSESEVTTTTAEGKSHGSSQHERRFSTSHITPTAAAFKKFLTDDTSDSNPTTSISAFSRRKSLPGILTLEQEGYKSFPMTTSKEGDNDGRKELQGSKEDEDEGCSESETTSIGESILDPPPQRKTQESSFTRDSSELRHLPERKHGESQGADNKSILGNAGAENYRETGNYYDSEDNKSIHLSSSSSVEMPNPIKIADEEPHQVDVEAFGGTTEDFTSSSRNAIKNLDAGESATRQVKASQEEQHEHQPLSQKSHQLKLKLGIYEDSESDKSEIEVSDSAKNTVGSAGKKEFENTGQTGKKGAEVDDDDFDDFFDL